MSPTVPVGLQLTATAVVADADLVVFLVIGAFAGAHCLGMCEPLAGVYADRMTEQRTAGIRDHITLFQVRQHALFNGCRIVGHAAVGALFGLLGVAFFALGCIPVSHGLVLLGFGVSHIDLPYYQPLTDT